MNRKIKHRWLATSINAFLQLGFALLIITFTVNLLADLFHFKKYITYKNLTLGTAQDGYKLRAGMHVSIPDTTITYKDGQRNVFSSLPRQHSRKDDNGRVKTEVVVNGFKTFEKKDILISNNILISNPVDIYVNSSNLKYKIFWSFYTQIDFLFSIFFFLLLIKLLNRYTNDKIFEQKTFKLIAGFGWLIIWRDVISFLMAFVNGKIIESFYFSSVDTMTGTRLNNVGINVNFYDGFTFSNIGIGLLILLLAYVMKEAILAKNENDLTV